MSAADDAEQTRKFSEVADRIDWEVLGQLDALHPEQGFGGCVAENEGQLCCMDFLLADYRKRFRESMARVDAARPASPPASSGA
ncbi:MAG TPA: hypothetical protein VGD68_18170 [Streptosporangiaceae bacterium]